MDNQPTGDGRRVSIKKTIGLLAQESGFQAISDVALETLTDMLTALLSEMGRTTRVYTEHAGRVEPTVGDFTMALIDMGLPVDPVGLAKFAHRPGRQLVEAPGSLPLPQIPFVLASGRNLHLPSDLPDYLPLMPDPRSYLRTPQPQERVSDYAVCRVMKSQQKVDCQLALIKFMAQRSDCYYPFPGDKSAFPLMSPKPVTYLDALLPNDQVFENPPEMEEKVAEKVAEKGEESPKAKQLEEMETETKEPELVLVDSDATTDVESMDDELSAAGDKIEGRVVNPYLEPVVPRAIPIREMSAELADRIKRLHEG